MKRMILLAAVLALTTSSAFAMTASQSEFCAAQTGNDYAGFCAAISSTASSVGARNSPGPSFAGGTINIDFDGDGTIDRVGSFLQQTYGIKPN